MSQRSDGQIFNFSDLNYSTSSTFVSENLRRCQLCQFDRASLIWRASAGCPSGWSSTGSRRSSRSLLLVILAAILLSTWAPAFAGAASNQQPFSWPSGLAVTGSDLWVANSMGNSLTEIDIHSGSVVRTVGTQAYGFHTPQSIATDGKSLWVANSQGHSVTEVNAQSGSLIRVIDPKVHRIVNPLSVVYGDGDLWVTSGGNVDHNSSIVELNPSTGKTIRILTKGIYATESLAVNGENIWVGNSNDTITEFSAKSGTFERVINLTGLGKGVESVGFAPYKDNVWILNGSSTEPGTNYSIVEVRSSNGSVIREVNASSLGINTYKQHTSALASDGKNIWIAVANKVVEISDKNGALENVIQGDGFSNPHDLIVTGRTLWISNVTGGVNSLGSLTELSIPGGHLVRVIR